MKPCSERERDEAPTAEMVSAGLDVLLSFYPEDLRAEPEEAVRSIYMAMSAVAAQSRGQADG